MIGLIKKQSDTIVIFLSCYFNIGSGSSRSIWFCI